MEEKKEFMFKVLVVGDAAVGKTSIIRRYLHHSFSQHYKLTIGVDFGVKIIHLDESTVIKMQLWDIAGQERFGNMTKAYYRGAAGAFVVFDVTRSSSFAAVEAWKRDLDSKVFDLDGFRIPIVLLGNKSDQLEDDWIKKNRQQMDKFVTENGFVAWYHTSAKINTNIECATNFLVKRMLENVEKNNFSQLKNGNMTLDIKQKSKQNVFCCT